MTTINMWHVIGGEWVHLMQVQHSDKTKMYVDGKLSGEVTEGSLKINKPGNN
jgi:hypothetical protein